MISRDGGVAAVMTLLLGLIGACAVSAPGLPLAPTGSGHGRQAAVWIPGSTSKICQLTGQLDRQTGDPTLNETGFRFGLYGTDLGASFEYLGRTEFLFGDTQPTEYFDGSDNLGWRPQEYNDSIAYTLGADPDQCLVLQFVTGPSGAYASPELRSPSGKPISLGDFEVPISGFAVGNKMYVFFAVGHPPGLPRGPYVRSVLGCSTDGGKTFTEVRDFSAARFVNVATAVADASTLPGLPFNGGKVLLVWGSEGGARYRLSTPYLAVLPLYKLAESGDTRYFAGFAPGAAAPRWSATEDEAAPLFESHCVGELSAQWNPAVGRWLMLNGCADPRGINLRQAERPWGPWSEPQVIFSDTRDGRYFMHQPYSDRLGDPGREATAASEYAPFFLPFFKYDHDQATIYYTMSTWNPYERRAHEVEPDRSSRALTLCVRSSRPIEAGQRPLLARHACAS